MTASTLTIYLLDVATGQDTVAELRDAIEQAQLDDWKMKWQPALHAVLHDLMRSGVQRSDLPQGWHWNWDRKTSGVKGLLGFQGFSVVALGETQGLALVNLTKSCRMPNQAGKPLVYLDYLEAAPWNRRELIQPPRFRGVGTALVTAAVVLSEHEGFKGRLGLHSLKKAEDFYRRTCGMTDLGTDPLYQDLRYFEMTAEQAKAFLK